VTTFVPEVTKEGVVIVQVWEGTEFIAALYPNPNRTLRCISKFKQETHLEAPPQADMKIVGAVVRITEELYADSKA
jgi:hypothetical protein